MTQRVDKQIGSFPAIEPKRHFVKVGREMLGADLVPRSDDASLQEREGRFDSVSRDARAVLVSGIFLGGVIDGFMIQVANCTRVGREFVGNDYFHVSADVFFDVFRQCTFLGIVSVEEPQIAATLPNTDDNFFGVPFAAPAGTVAPLLAADVGFVHFDSTVKHGLIDLFHGCADTVAEIPSGLVRPFIFSPDRALELHRAHSLLSFAEQENRDKPDRQREMGVVEDRTASGCELVFAANTFIAGIFLEPGDSRVFAAWTHHAFGPAEPFQQFPAAVVSRIERINFWERHDRAS